MQAQNSNTSRKTTPLSGKESKLTSFNAAIIARPSHTPKSAKSEPHCNTEKTTEYFDFVGVAG